LTELLDEFADVFDQKPGKTDLITHKLHVTDDTPIWQLSYPIPLALRDQVHDELQKLLDADIIQYDAETRYNSPLIVIKKPDGGVKLCNNFVLLNQKSVPEKYQMTDANKLLSRVAGAKFQPKIDLQKFFFQIGVHTDSQHLTGFWTPSASQMSYRRLPMGLSESPITAQRLIDHLRDVLERLRAAGLTANKAKCEFASNHIKILGFVVKDGAIHSSGRQQNTGD